MRKLEKTIEIIQIMVSCTMLWKARKLCERLYAYWNETVRYWNDMHLFYSETQEINIARQVHNNLHLANFS